jgi:hypothetical protein
MFNDTIRTVPVAVPSPHYTEIHECILGTGDPEFERLHRMGRILCFSARKQYQFCVPTPSVIGWECPADIYDQLGYP